MNLRQIIRKTTITMLAAVTVTAGASGTFAATTYSDNSNGGHAILVNGTTKTYDNVLVTKTGSSSSEDADFYGTNAAVLATSGGTLVLSNSKVTTNGGHANAVFSYGSGTTVNVSDTTITTQGNNSGGIMTTGGGTMNAVDLTVNTSGNSSAPIRSDRGGGTVKVTGGTYKATGVGSPAIYSTAAITCSKTKLITTASEAIVIEGGNSVTLNNCTVTGNNTTKNGQSKYLNNVLIYQSMSGDASSGASYFTMNGGTMTSKSGAMFHVTNTTTTINLYKATLNLSGDLLLSASCDNWGRSGSNGGKVTMNASNQTLKGTITIDSGSSLALNLTNSSTYTGKINTTGQTGSVSVSVASGCTWNLTGNTYISSLTNKGTINTGSYKLYVNGTAYAGSTSASKTILKLGTTFTYGKFQFCVTRAATSSTPGQVQLVKAVGKVGSTLTIYNAFKYSGYYYYVTSIGARAFKGNTTIQKVILKSNMKSIGKFAFFNCKNLKTIVIYSKKLISANIGYGAFLGVYSTVNAQLPSAKFSYYKKMLLKRGLTTSAVFTKM